MLEGGMSVREDRTAFRSESFGGVSISGRVTWRL